jgi:hypothetical protein
MTPEAGAATSTDTGDAAAIAAAAAAAAASKPALGQQPADAAAEATAAAAAADAGKDKTEPTAEAKAAAAAAALAAAGAPAKYELKVPPGGLVYTSHLKVIEDLARKANYTNVEAQAYLDEHALAAKAQSDGFLAETTADADLGGAHLAETMRLANVGIDRIYPKDDPDRAAFLEFLHAGGGDNNITVVRAFVRVAQMTGEDRKVSGRGTARGGERKSDAEVLFGG